MLIINNTIGGSGIDTIPLINNLPEVAKKRDLIRKCLKGSINITTEDEKGDTVLYIIASIPKKEKITWLNLILKAGISKDQLEKVINAKNRDVLTTMQKALHSKINKKSYYHRTISSSDNTFRFIVVFLNSGAKVNQLQLSEEYLEALSSSQKKNYHINFLKKLISKYTITQVNTNITQCDSGFESAPEDINTKSLIHETKKTEPILAKNKSKNPYSTIHENSKTKEGFDSSLKAVKEKNLANFKKYLGKISVTTKDKEGNNILHLIASMPNKTKITWLNIISKYGTFDDKLTEAINATNKKGYTPIQVAIVNKITKDTHRAFTISDNTVNFCIKLLNHIVLNNEAKSEDCRLHFVLPGKHSSDRYIKFLQKLIKDERINAIHTKDILDDTLKEQIAQHKENKKLNNGIKNTRNNCWNKAKKCGKVTLDFINPNKTVDRMTKLAIAALTVVAAFFTFVIIAFAAINGQLPIAAAVPIMLAFVVNPIVIKYFQSNNGLEETDNSAKNEKHDSRMTDILTGAFNNSVRVLN